MSFLAAGDYMAVGAELLKYNLEMNLDLACKHFVTTAVFQFFNTYHFLNSVS